jgi:hypothetical protein
MVFFGCGKQAENIRNIGHGFLSVLFLAFGSFESGVDFALEIANQFFGLGKLALELAGE